MVTDPCYKVEPTLGARFEIEKLQVYREWLNRDDVNPLVRDAIQATYNITIIETSNAKYTKTLVDDMPR